MGRQFEIAKELWDAEVDILAANMVRKGTPPSEAIIRANHMVAQNRKREARNVKYERKGKVRKRTRKI